MFSSGYGSQAVSSNTLSSDDSMSLRSISVDDTPDTEVAPSPKIHLDHVTVGAALQQQTQRQSSATTQEEEGSRIGQLLSPPDVSLTSISPGKNKDLKRFRT